MSREGEIKTILDDARFMFSFDGKHIYIENKEELAQRINSLFPQLEENEEGLLTDESIYKLNEADTEQRRHHFWESGVLDTCKEVAKAQHALDLQHEREVVEGIFGRMELEFWYLLNLRTEGWYTLKAETLAQYEVKE